MPGSLSYLFENARIFLIFIFLRILLTFPILFVKITKKRFNMKKNKKDTNVFLDAILNICDAKNLPVWLCGFLLFSGTVIAFNYIGNAKDNSRQSDDMKLVEAVATDNPYYKYTELNNKIIYSASLPVDIDGDGEHDFYVELIKNKKFNGIENEPLLNIKKGDKLVLEGFVAGNGHKIMKPVGNSSEILEGDVLSANKKRNKYISAKNIIAIEKNLVNMPKNNNNVYKVVEFLNQQNR